YQHSSWLTMMGDRLLMGWSLLGDPGHLHCHIDENEYERLAVLCNALDLNILGTIIWDKKNPMLGRQGIATQHEYVLWCSKSVASVYVRNDAQRMILDRAKEIIATHEGVTEKAKREFSSWIKSVDGLTGGERAYCFLDDDGRVYQSAGLAAPEPRTDPKFFVPLI